MNYKRANPGVIVVNDVIYVRGGDDGSVSGNLVYATVKSDPTVDITEAYEPVTDTWTVKTTMPTARTLFATAVWNEKIYGIGVTIPPFLMIRKWGFQFIHNMIQQ